MDWLTRTDWSRRSLEFGVATLSGLHVEIEYFPALTEQAWRAWRALGQANLLQVERVGVLRYAAIDWNHQALAVIDETTIARFASWGIVLARAYEHIAQQVAERAWLARPLVKFDVEGVMRIGFLPTKNEHVPPETLDQWPLLDERAMVHVVASALVGLAAAVPWESHIGTILVRCLDRDPAKRIPTLAALRDALFNAGAKHVPPVAPPRSATWVQLEAGLGFLAVDRTDLALPCLREAQRRDPKSKAASQLYEQATMGTARQAAAASGVLENDVFLGAATTRLPPTRVRPWSEVRAEGEQLERARDFVGALRLYKLVQCEDDAAVLAHALARARCRLEIGDADRAVAFAREVLARDPARHEARAIEARALLRVKLFTETLAATDAWIAAAPDDGLAHYLRGRALFALRRLALARDAFDRACTLGHGQELVVAGWMRTAIDRSIAKVRATVGVAFPMPVDLPPGPVRDALVAGRIDDAIALLEPSQLKGDLLSYAGRFEEAIAVFDAIQDEAALAGKARALIDLGRTDEALAVLATIDADADGFVAIRR